MLLALVLSIILAGNSIAGPFTPTQNKKKDFTEFFDPESYRIIHKYNSDFVILPSDSTVRNGSKGAYDYPPTWNMVINTGGSVNPLLITINDVAEITINGEQIQPGDWIGAFYEDNDGSLKCAGADYWQAEGIIFSVFGDIMSTPDKEGFGYAESLNWRIFSWETQSTYDVDQYAFDPAYLTYNKWYPLGFVIVLKLNCFEDIIVKANSVPEILCSSGDVTLDVEDILTGTGSLTYNWSSIPEGFNSNEKSPIFTLDESVTFVVEATDGASTANSLVQVFVTENPVVDAGNDQDVCGVSSVSLSGTASDYLDLIWETSGDGLFTDPNALITEYQLGDSDFTNGQINLTLTVNPLEPCTLVVSDPLDILLYPAPEPVILVADTNTCGGLPYSLSGSASNYYSLEWTTSGDGAFSDPYSLNPTYTPGSSDENNGSVLLSLVATGISPCNIQRSDNITLLIHDQAYVYVGVDQTMCEPTYFQTNPNAHDYS
nr:hypothetical protein [Bacteroidota bacterium]